jgi:hypothetical protein
MKMYRRFTYKNNYKYIEILPELIESYNKSYHRTIKMALKDVTKEKRKNYGDRCTDMMKSI